MSKATAITYSDNDPNLDHENSDIKKFMETLDNQFIVPKDGEVLMPFEYELPTLKQKSHYKGQLMVLASSSSSLNPYDIFFDIFQRHVTSIDGKPLDRLNGYVSEETLEKIMLEDERLTLDMFIGVGGTIHASCSMTEAQRKNLL